MKTRLGAQKTMVQVSGANRYAQRGLRPLSESSNLGHEASSTNQPARPRRSGDLPKNMHSFQLYNPRGDGVFCEASGRVDVQLSHDVVAMTLSSLVRNAEFLCNLLACVTFCY